jgi:GTP pyrophosphokinase
MSLSAITLYTSPPGTVYPSEFDPSSRGSPPCSTAAPPTPAASHRLPSACGGLSCLFSSPAAAAAPPRAPAHDELGALWHDRSDDQCVAGGSYSYSHSSSPLKWRDLHHHHHHSPVSVFQGPSSSSPSRSPQASWLTGRERDRLFAGFVRNALGSCVDYAPAASPRPEVGAGELAFELDENLAETSPACEPYVGELLAGAQDRHRIFHEEVVVKAFLEAEKAHRGQVKQAPNFSKPSLVR